MAEKPFKVGLLGLGVMGRRHLDAYRSLPGVEVLTRTSARFAHLQDPDALYEAMIADPELDALDICLPTALHAPLTIAALDAGKHVLCEKPMALTVEACGRMLEAGKRNKGVLMVAHVLRFWPAYRVLHDAVAQGHLWGCSLGEIRAQIRSAWLGSMAVAAGGERRRPAGSLGARLRSGPVAFRRARERDRAHCGLGQRDRVLTALPGRVGGSHRRRLVHR